MTKMFSPSNMFLKFLFCYQNMKKPASKVAKPAQIQPKSQFLFHKNLPPRDFSIMTLNVSEGRMWSLYPAAVHNIVLKPLWNRRQLARKAIFLTKLRIITHCLKLWVSYLIIAWPIFSANIFSPISYYSYNNFWQQNIKFQNISDYWFYWTKRRAWRSKPALSVNLKIPVRCYYNLSSSDSK